MTMLTTDAVRRQVVLVAAAAATSALLLKSADNLRKRQISRDEEEDHFPVPSGAKFVTLKLPQKDDNSAEQSSSSPSSSSSSSPSMFAVPRELHDKVVSESWRRRGWDEEEAAAATELCSEAAYCGVSSHNFIKALDIDDHLGAGLEGDARGCIPGRRWVELSNNGNNNNNNNNNNSGGGGGGDGGGKKSFGACRRWDARKCSGFLVARAAVDRAMELADEHGVGVVMVDNAFHYLWGAGWVLRASRKGYICFTTCTGAIPEVVPFQGKVGTMGTNPWTWALPTAATRIGFDFVFDWATSVMSNGSVKALARAGRRVPEGAIVDRKGRPTVDPAELGAHQCFGGHKGFGLCALTELLAAFGGGSLPSLRCAGGYTPYWKKGGAEQEESNGSKKEGREGDSSEPTVPPGEKTSCNFYFQVMRPDAIAGANYAIAGSSSSSSSGGEERSQGDNVAAVAADILGHGNSPSHSSEAAAGVVEGGCGTARLPGWGKHAAMQRSEAHGGALLFSAPEVDALRKLGAEAGIAMPDEFPLVNDRR